MEPLNFLREKARQLLEQNTNDEHKRRKFEIIYEKLKDDGCFLDMDIEHGYAVLRDLEIDENSIRDHYSKLISK